MALKDIEITFIATGGTIDKDYSRNKGTYNFDFGEPAIKRILEIIVPDFNYKIISVLKKDSLDMTDEDRELVYNACKNSNSNKIVITHGTDTMIETAKKLKSFDLERRFLKDKTIIITGAGQPEKFKDSDAPFNIGASIAGVHFLRPGVYLSMNGKIRHWEKCHKMDSGKFVENIIQMSRKAL